MGSDSAVSPPTCPPHPRPASVSRSSRSLRASPPQVSIRLDGESKALEYNAVGAVKDAVRVVFRGPRVSDLFDRDWHKVALSVQAQNVTLHVDCALVQTLPIEERENIDIQGKTVIGKRLYDSVPVDVSTSQVLGSLGEASGARCPRGPPHLPVSFTRSSPWTVLGGGALTQKTAASPSLTPSFLQLRRHFIIYHVHIEPLLCAGHCGQGRLSASVGGQGHGKGISVRQLPVKVSAP